MAGGEKGRMKGVGHQRMERVGNRRVKGLRQRRMKEGAQGGLAGNGLDRTGFLQE